MKSIRFLIDPTRKLASSILRGEQLCSLCASFSFFTSGHFHFSMCYDYNEPKDEFVILCKSFLAFCSVENLRGLRSRGNTIVADWLDYTIREEFTPFLHAFISSSRGQHRFLTQKYPEFPVYHLTHHVDSRIPEVKNSLNYLRAAYFGNPINLRYRTIFQKFFDVIDASSTEDQSWIDKLPLFNCHISIRDMQSWDGFKPFTKGFIAAHCRSVIVVDDHDSEALYYLGEDYPFRFSLKDEASVPKLVSSLHERFGGSDWNLAVERMDSLRRAVSMETLKVELSDLLGNLTQSQASFACKITQS